MLLFCSTLQLLFLPHTCRLVCQVRVGAQTGLAHALVKRTLSFAKRSSVGRLGLCPKRIAWHRINPDHQPEQTIHLGECYLLEDSLRGSRSNGSVIVSHARRLFPTLNDWDNCGQHIKNRFGTLLGIERRGIFIIRLDKIYIWILLIHYCNCYNGYYDGNGLKFDLG